MEDYAVIDGSIVRVLIQQGTNTDGTRAGCMQTSYGVMSDDAPRRRKHVLVCIVPCPSNDLARMALVLGDLGIGLQEDNMR